MDWELLMEAERRGILPADKAELLTEARRRGLAPSASAKAVGQSQATRMGHGDSAQASAGQQQSASGQYATQTLSQPLRLPSVKEYLGQSPTPDGQPQRQMIADHMGPGQAAIQGAAQGVSFGANDEISGLLGGLSSAATDWSDGGSVMDKDRSHLARARHRFDEGYDEARDLAREALDVARERHPVAAFGGELAGAVAAPGAALGVAKSASNAARIGRGAAAGAATGGLYGFNAGEGSAEQRLDNAQNAATIGAGLGAAAPLTANALRGLWESHLSRKAVNKMIRNAPSAETLKHQAGELYDKVRNGGQFATPQEVAAVRSQAEAALRQRGIIDGAGNALEGYSAALKPMRSLDAAARDGLDGRQVQPIKNILQEAADSPLGTRAEVGQILRDTYDDFVKAQSPARAEADKLYSRAKKVEGIDQLIGAAAVEDTANSLRTKFKTLGRRDVKGQLPGWTADEVAAAQRVVKGGPGERILRGISTVAPNSALSIFAGTTGPGLAGYALGGPAGAAIAAGGTALAGGVAKRSANAIQRRNADIAKAIVATGSDTPTANTDVLQKLVIERLLSRSAPRSGAALSQQQDYSRHDRQ